LSDFGVGENDAVRIFNETPLELGYTRSDGMIWIQIFLPSDDVRTLTLYSGDGPERSETDIFNEHLLVWHFDDSSLSTTGEVAQSGNEDFVPGVFNNGASFDGSVGSIRTANPARLNDMLDQGFTFSTWLILNAPSETLGTIFRLGVSGDSGASLTLVVDEDRKVVAQVDLGEGIMLASFQPLSLDEPHHIAFTFSEGVFRLYIDGGIVDQAALDVSIADDNSLLYFGGNSEGGGSPVQDFLTGVLDEVRFRNVESTSSYISASYRNGVGEMITRIGGVETW